MTKTYRFLLAAGISLALAFTFSCSGGGGDGTTSGGELSRAEIDDVIKELHIKSNTGGTSVDLVQMDGSGILTNSVTFVGWTVDIFKGPTIFDALVFPLFDDAIYADASGSGRGNRYIESTPVNAVNGTYFISDKLNEVYSSFAIDGSVSTGKFVPFFSGKVSSQYDRTVELKSAAKFYNSIFSAETNRHTLKPIYQLPEGLAGLINKKLIDVINSTEITPKELFDFFGTHIILASSVGGTLNITGLYNSNESATTQDISVALDFQSSYINGAAKTTVTDKQKKIASETKITVNAYGGAVSTLFANASIEKIGAAMEAWGNTVKDDATIAKIYKAVPIWQLATDAQRRSTLENYFYENAERINQELLEYFSKSERPKEPVIENNATYNIVNALSQKCIDVKGPSTDDGVVLNLWDCEGTPQQKWTAIESLVYRGWFSFKNGYSGKMMDVAAANTNNELIQYQKNGTDAQLFRVEDVDSSGLVILYSKLGNGSLRVTPRDNPQNNGSWLFVFNNSYVTSRWVLQRVK